MKKVVFWGAGRYGRLMVEFWREFNLKPDFFCDNNHNLWGEYIDGVKIISPQEVYEFGNDVEICITCAAYDEISDLLKRHGVSANRIIRADGLRQPRAILCLSELWKSKYKNTALRNRHGVVIDLSNGMVLGGVERWSYDVATIFKGMKRQGVYFVSDYLDSTVVDSTFPSVIYSVDIGSRGLNGIRQCMDRIISVGYGNVLCNFPDEVFYAACLTKKNIGIPLNIIGIIHSDYERYYEAYSTWEKYINCCLVISKRIEDKLVRRGFPKQKIKYLYWRINCEEQFERTYSTIDQPIRIGYAGRLVKYQKRIDLVGLILKRLKELNVNFILEIAGIGRDENIVKEAVKELQLEKSVVFNGLIKHENIPDFWKKQDIYINCSEEEGHSISQVEAMAFGAVPVATDVSGARDDIIDGYNGYIVDIGDINGMAERIQFLYRNRYLLADMGRRSHEMIIEHNSLANSFEFWDSIL